MGAINGPLRQLNETMENIVQGKLDGRIKIERDDEIGEALRNLQTVQTIVRFSKEELKASERRAAIQRRGEMVKLADGFEGAVGEIVGWAYDGDGRILAGHTNERVVSVSIGKVGRAAVIGAAMGPAKLMLQFEMESCLRDANGFFLQFPGTDRLAATFAWCFCSRIQSFVRASSRSTWVVSS